MKPLTKEVKQHRWRMIRHNSHWMMMMIGHTLRQDQNSDCNVAMTWAPKGKTRGRPKTMCTWTRAVEKKRAEAGWRLWEEVKTVAAN